MAVLDDVRRLMEERGTLGLVYIDLGADGHVEPVHGWQAFDELLRGFARTLVSLRDAGHLGPRDIVAAMSVRSDKFLVFLRGGDGATLDEDSSRAAPAGCASGSWRPCPPTSVRASSCR